MTTTCTGVAETLEAAVRAAHDKIKSTQRRDFVVSKVTAWGMQFGGIAQARRFWVEVVEDTAAPLRSDG